MTNEIHEIDKDVPDSFLFRLGGKLYRMRYPVTEEVDNAQKKVRTKKSFDYKDWMYSFITPEDSDAPPIGEALGKANVKVVANFNDMINEEFNVQL